MANVSKINLNGVDYDIQDTQSSTELDALEARVTSNEQSIANISGEITTARADIASNTSAIAATNTEITNVKQTAADNTTSINTMGETVGAINARVKVNEDYIATLNKGTISGYDIAYDETTTTLNITSKTENAVTYTEV